MRPSSRRPADLRQTVGRSARWSLVQTIVSALTIFALYKILYAQLGPEQLGIWAVVLASVSVARLAELGFSTTVLRFVSMRLTMGDRERAARILETGVVSIAWPLALILIAAYPLADSAMRLVVPGEKVLVAQDILPFALATLWFGIVGSVAQSALDGCGRMDIKCRVLIVGNLAYVPAAILMVNYWGLPGLAICQLLQAVGVTIFVWAATRRELPALHVLPAKWDQSCFREILGYAASLQLGNLLLMLFEPATKILLSRYCGLSEVAHFEMANQVVSRVRSLITSAMQAYLPALSSADSIPSLRGLVGEATMFAAGIGVPMMAVIVISFPLISTLWIGYLQTDFVIFGQILGVGWLIATLAVPTYYYCVGAGKVGAILGSQALIVGLNGILGFSAAVSGLGHWVAVSMMVSLVAGNLLTTTRAIFDLGTSFGSVLKLPSARNSVITTFVTGSVLALDAGITWTIPREDFLYSKFVLELALIALIVYLSDARVQLTARYRRGR